MKLGQIVNEYRRKNKLSMDAFAKKSGISKGYISMLESGKRPASGKEVIPSISIIKKAADGMNMDFDDLFAMMADEIVSLDEKDYDKFDSGSAITNLQQQILDISSQLSLEKQQFLLTQAKVLLHSSEEL